MSALLIDLPLAQVPATAARPRRWVHVVPDSGQVEAPPAPPQVISRPVSVPAARPVPAAPAAPLRLTRRGLAVVVGGFGLLMMTALVVLVVSFLAVSNEPLVGQFPLG